MSRSWAQAPPAWRPIAPRPRTPRNVLLIEGGEYGTMCARVGCMPSKLLISAAEAAHVARNAAPFGVHVEVAHRWPRGDGIAFAASAIVSSASWSTPSKAGPKPIACAVTHASSRPTAAGGYGHHRQHGPHRHRHRLAPQCADEWRAALGDKLLVNDDVFAWQTLPKSVAVIGTGVIGLEIAQALHRLGVRVRVYGRGTRRARSPIRRCRTSRGRRSVPNST